MQLVEHADDQARPPLVNVVVACHSDLHRYGMERLLHHIGVHEPIPHYRGVAEAVGVASSAAVRPIVISAMGELADESARSAVRAAASRGVRVIVVVELDRLDTGIDLGVLLDVPTVGFVDSEDLDSATLAAALRASESGTMPIPPRLVRALLHRSQRNAEAEARRTRLTPREQHTLTLMAKGLSNRQIARSLEISEHGAKRHVANVMSKLNCSNRTQAVAVALRDGLCEVEH